MPQEIVIVNTGQAGCQKGSAIWELLAGEHDINVDGKFADPANYDNTDCENYFFRNSRDILVPRSIFTDLEDTVVDQILNGAYKNFFHCDMVLKGHEDAGSIFARGYWTTGATQIERFSECMRYQSEIAECLTAMVLVHSTGGGTGSGLGSLQIQQLADDFPKKSKLQCGLWPSEQLQTNMVEAYNGLLSMHYNSDILDAALVWDNESLYRICTNLLRIKAPRYTDLNRLTAQFMSAITASSRFGGPLTSSLQGYMTNLVPYPRIRYPVCSYGPLVSRSHAQYEDHNVISIVQSLFSNSAQFARLDMERGNCLASCLLLRGQGAPNDVYRAVAAVKARESVRYVDWCPTGFKVSLCQQEVAIVPASNLGGMPCSATLLANSTGINDMFSTARWKFGHLFSKRAFLHWFIGEGLEESEFSDAMANMVSLIEDYKSCACTTEQQVDHPAPPANKQARPKKDTKPAKTTNWCV